ncbi:hypothetical protein SAMN05421541_101509 [Actinoplanes philippinensis]|uniref:Uncharacterized protein n=1 Tax=Actinoplanes philippinensis TaxID=35752 RepID=A0A1I2A5E8_9ACTN|nr:hypothetical protein [Actinoplanes philippinensis]SFE38959.1 hypothetical protein SAMN05421541_101509 [Actinoplanes philippinensis]
MRLVLPARRRRTVVAAGAVALVAAITTALFLKTGPSAATWQTLSGSPTCDCIVKDSSTGRYRAVFGYVSDASGPGTIAAGANNRLVFSGGTTSTDATVAARFSPGTHRAAFATGWVSRDTRVTWQVGGKSVAAYWNRPACGDDVSLPTGGNGFGPILGFLAAGVIAAVVAGRRRRRAAGTP